MRLTSVRYTSLVEGRDVIERPDVLFVCPHGAAKSVIAAAYCRQLAAERGIVLRVASAGTEPEPAVPPPVVAALASEGIDLSEYRPRQLTREDIARAGQVITIGCDVSEFASAGKPIERWDDVPLVSDGLEAARVAIRTHVVRLLDGWEGERHG